MQLAAATLTIAATAAVLTAQTAPLRVVPDVDLQRYSGTWYEVARLPNRFEKKCAGDITATYALRPDGRIAVTNRCRLTDGGINEASGVARRVKNQPPSVLQVRFAPSYLSFLPMVWGDYNILELGSAYEYALVGSPDRKYLWVLSRAPRIDRALYLSLLDRAKGQGFDTSAMIEVANK